MSIIQKLLKIIKICKRYYKVENVPNLSCKNEYNQQTNKKNCQTITYMRYFSESAENGARFESQ